MGKNRLNLEYVLQTNVKKVYAHILDLRKFGMLHPHMTDVRLLESQTDAYKEYLIHEEFLLLKFFRFKPKYRAKVVVLEEYKHLQYQSKIFGMGLVINFIFILDVKEGTTRVLEKVEFKANKLIALLFFNILKKAHFEVFQNLRVVLASKGILY